jgi:hypothetical protein
MELATMAGPGDFSFNNLFQNSLERQAYYERSPVIETIVSTRLAFDTIEAAPLA